MTLGLGDINELNESLSLEQVKDEEARYTFNHKGRNVLIGCVYKNEDDEYVYVSYREKDSHYMYKHDGYPLNVSVIEELQEQFDISEIVIVEDRRNIYIFNIEQYMNADAFNEGYGDQKCAELDSCVSEFTGVSHIAGTYYPDELTL